MPENAYRTFTKKHRRNNRSKNRRRNGRFRPAIEALEPRLVLATMAFHGLEFVADSFDTAGTQVSADGRVDLKVAGDNTRLLEFSEGVSFQTTNNATGRFTPLGTVSLTNAAGTATSQLLDGSTHSSFSATALLGGGVTIAANEINDVDALRVAGVDFSVSSLKIAGAANDPVLQMRGKVALPQLPGLKFTLPSNTYVQSGANGVQLAKNFTLTVKASFSFKKFKLEADNLMVTYARAESELRLSGSVKLMLTDKLIVQASIDAATPIRINTNTGAFSLGNEGLMISGTFTLGPFSAEAMLKYTDGPGGVTVEPGVKVHLPQGIDVMGSFQLVGDQLSEITLGYSDEIGKPIGTTGFFLTGLEGSLKGLNSGDLSGLEVKGTIHVRFAKKLLGQDLVTASGTVTLDKDHLNIAADIKLVGGKLGDATGSIDLNWTTGVFVISAELRLIKFGDSAKPLIVANGKLYIDKNGNFSLDANIEVRIPDPLPYAGTKLASGQLRVQVRPNNASQSYVRIYGNILAFRLGYQFNFDGTSKFLGEVERTEFLSCVNQRCKYTNTRVPVVDYYDYNTITVRSDSFKAEGFGGRNTARFQVRYFRDGARLPILGPGFDKSKDRVYGIVQLDGNDSNCRAADINVACAYHAPGSDTITFRVPAITKAEARGDIVKVIIELEGITHPVWPGTSDQAKPKVSISGHIAQPAYLNSRIDPHPTVPGQYLVHFEGGTRNQDRFLEPGNTSTVGLHYWNIDTEATGLITEFNFNQATCTNDIIYNCQFAGNNVDGRFKFSALWTGLPDLLDASQVPYDSQKQPRIRLFVTVEDHSNPVFSKDLPGFFRPLNAAPVIEAQEKVEPTQQDQAFAPYASLEGVIEISEALPLRYILEVSVNHGGYFRDVDDELDLDGEPRDFQSEIFITAAKVRENLSNLIFQTSDEYTGNSELKITLTSFTTTSRERREFTTTVSIPIASTVLRPDTLESNNSIGGATVVAQDVYRGLSIHDRNDEDFFKINLPSAGTADNFVKIEEAGETDNVRIDLLDVNGRLQKLDTDGRISLEGRAAGVYFVKAYAFAGETGSYDITFNLPEAGPEPDRLESNNSKDEATLVAQDAYGDLSIHDGADRDYFLISLPTTGTAENFVEIKFLHASGDLDLELLNFADPPTRAGISQSITDDERLELAGVAAGDYLVHVYGDGAGTAKYDISFNLPATGITADDLEGNDSFEKATVVTQDAFEGLSIHDATDRDYFKIKLLTDGTDADFVEINFVPTFGDLDLQLLKPDGTQAGFSGTEENFERISLSGLPAGEYFVHVYGWDSGTANYDITFKLPKDFLESNNSRDEATVVSQPAFSDLSIHDKNDKDYFKIKLLDPGTADRFVRIDFTHSVGDLDLELLNSDGTRAGLSDSREDFEQVALTGLAAGDYFVHVYGYESATGKYDITFNLPEDRLESNDSIANATVVTEDAYSGLSIHDAGDFDYFKIDLLGTGSAENFVRIDFATTYGDLDLELLNKAGESVAFSGFEADFEQIPLTGLPMDEYIVAVYGWDSGTGKYDITFNLPNPDRLEPNNTDEEPTVVTADAYTNLSIHDETDVDFFKITLPSQTGANFVEARFAQSDGDLDLELKNAAGEVVAFGETETDNERISLAGLAAGEYVLQVYGYDSATANYDLILGDDSITLPSRDNQVSLEDGNVVVRSGGNIVFQDARDNVTELNLVGSDQDDLLTLGKLGLVDGAPVRISFDGRGGIDGFSFPAGSQFLDLVSSKAIRLTNIGYLSINGSGANSLALGLNEVVNLSTESNRITVSHGRDDFVEFGSGWTVRPHFLGIAVHLLEQDGARVTVINDTLWRNPVNPLDSSRDGEVSAVDALVIINSLNAKGARELAAPTSEAELPEFYTDPSGDRFISAIDALQVINFLNGVNIGLAEGEGSVASPEANHFASIVQRATSFAGSPPSNSLQLDSILPEAEAADDLDNWRRVMTPAATTRDSSPATNELSTRRTDIPLEELIDQLAADVADAMSQPG